MAPEIQDELVALLDAVDVDAKPLGHTDWAIFLAAALTGLRPRIVRSIK